MLFPSGDRRGRAVRLALVSDGEGLPSVAWAGLSDDDVAATAGRPLMPLLGEHARGLYTRPHLRGHRIRDDGGQMSAGLDWSTLLRCQAITAGEDALTIVGADERVGLAVLLEFESVAGGVLRGRCTVTNTAPGDYLVEGLEVVLPVPERFTESLDFTGRHERERTPQRREVADGLWLREGRVGRPGLGAATLLTVGTPGFAFSAGEVFAVHVAWSGNSVLRLERDAATGTTLGGGELLQPGEVCLATGEGYTTPWVIFAASDEGLDGLAACWHDFERSLGAHPTVQPVVLNVWEAVYFDHDFGRLSEIAARAARVGVERFVLDDGWFRGRRDDTAGLGDWWVDEEVWPDGLQPLAERLRALGLGFGLWFEPEMVNPDSDLYRAHPDWILSAADRVPLLHRGQLVLDLALPEVFDYVYDRVHAILAAYPIEFVKWDHNRDLLEAGSRRRSGAPGVHEQTTSLYRLLDALRGAHPDVSWESCASGGGRVDLGVLERVERVWTSDSTDALARQQIQRWTTQLIAPEYLGAHVSAPTVHSTGRTYSLDFRAATALFGSFGVEWDLTTASEDDLERLADWIARYKRLRPLLHSGRVVRPDSSDPAVLLHGVVALDGSEALIAHVQMDESAHNRGVEVRVPGLDPAARYDLRWEGPVSHAAVSQSAPLPQDGPTAGEPVAGRALARHGFWMPRRRPETVTLVRLARAAT